MANNDWRLSGGLGIEEPLAPNQPVMLQGIGFPLRPIDNVPQTDTPTIPDGVVAEGLFIQWMGNWQEGLYYPKGAQVRDQDFLLIANKLTFGPAAPLNDGDPSWSVAAFAPIDNSNVSTIVCGHAYTITESGWIKALRVWVPALPDANIAYRMLVVVKDLEDQLESTTVNITPTAIDEWQLIALINTTITAGYEVLVSLESLNSGASTDIDGGWTYQGPSNSGVVPNLQSWTIDNGRSSFRIDKTDLDGTDRSTELEGVIPESEILVVETATTALTGTYRVTGVIDSGTYMSYAVVLINETGGGPRAGQVTNVEIDVPIPLATEYSEDTGTWPAGDPSWATVESFLEFDGVDQGVATSAFGVDIEFQPATVSPDWDIVVAP